MLETLNSFYHDSSDKLKNDINKSPENPEDNDIKKRYMKMQTEMEKIVNNGIISDLRWDKLLKTKWITSIIEENVDKILEILNIDKNKILLETSEELNYLSWEYESLIDNTKKSVNNLILKEQEKIV